jgi:hypothetical protein
MGLRRELSDILHLTFTVNAPDIYKLAWRSNPSQFHDNYIGLQV